MFVKIVSKFFTTQFKCSIFLSNNSLVFSENEPHSIKGTFLIAQSFFVPKGIDININYTAETEDINTILNITNMKIECSENIEKPTNNNKEKIEKNKIEQYKIEKYFNTCPLF